VVALTMVVFRELTDRVSQRVLAEEHHLVQALALD
jgi:hypothetical protein